MNIAQVASYYPPHLGGLENCAQEISLRLSSAGHKVYVLTSNIGSSGKNENKSANLKIFRLRSIEFAHTPIIFSLFFKLIQIPELSIIHLHVAHAFSPEIVFLVSKLKRVPYVAHIHLDVDPSGPWGFLLKPYKKLFLRPVLLNASKVICLSEKQKQAMIYKYHIPESRIVVFPNGVSEKFFVKREIKRVKVPKVIFVGRLASQKNLPKLIQAISLMKTKVTVNIVGDGEDRQKAEDKALNLGLKNVSFLGKKSGGELIDIYRKANLFVLTSDKEGSPLALLEAMAAGLPIVAPNIDGVNELLKGAGILVDDPTSKNFALNFDKLLSNLALQKTYSKKSRQIARSLSWENNVNKLTALYKEIIK